MPATNTDLSIATGQRLRQARTAAGLSQAALARALEATETDVYRWETGRNLPTASRLPAIAGTLKVTLDWLLGVKRTGGPKA